MSAKVRRIAILLQSLEGGGAQRRVVDIANGFIREGREVDLFLVNPSGKLRDRIAPDVRLFPAAELAGRLRSDPPGALLSGASAVHVRAVRSLPAERSFPLILRASSHPHRRFPPSMPRQRLGELGRRRRRMNAYAAADLIIAVADAVAEPLRDAFPGKPIEVIRNHVVTDEFLSGATARIDYPWRDDSSVPLIVGIGRLSVAKDFPTLVRAFALVRRSRELRLAIVGGGPDAQRRRLVRLAAKLGVASDVALIDHSDEVAAWLSRAQLLVSSSLWEGAPAVHIEALAMACPVIATDSPGAAREILADHELGALVPPRRPQPMADAIAKWLDRPVDQQRLWAATAPYRRDPTEQYLHAIDGCAERFAERSA
jgi:glycosyltransferase involved in cell wall biosynthesis